VLVKPTRDACTTGFAMKFTTLSECSALAPFLSTSIESTVLVDPEGYAERMGRENANRALGEVNRVMAAIYEEFWDISFPKVIAQVPQEFDGQFSNLKAEFPNFLGLLEHVEGACFRGLLRKSRAVPSMKILVAGPPGIGKTLVLQRIAEILGLHLHRISMNALMGAFELRGSGRQWKSPFPGAIAKCFKSSPVANPIVLLDEIDKGISRGDVHGRPLDALLDMMEETTGKVFHDECLDVDIDVTYAIYIATANDINLLPEPLLSRFTVVEAHAPSADQMKTVVEKIFSDLNEKEGNVFAPNLPPAIFEALKYGTPRNARHYLDCVLNAAAKRAVKQGMVGCHKPIAIHSSDIPKVISRSKPPIGFTP